MKYATLDKMMSRAIRGVLGPLHIMCAFSLLTKDPIVRMILYSSQYAVGEIKKVLFWINPLLRLTLHRCRQVDVI